MFVDYDKCTGCKYCAWECPYGARELDSREKMMKKCTLCVDRIRVPAIPVVVVLGIAIATGMTSLYAGAFLLQYAGLLAERWYFLAQANHPQNLYYQAIS